MDLKEFIFNNCFRLDDTLRSEISNKNWWVKKNFVERYYDIIERTKFLEADAKWAERIYCVLCDLDEKKLCKCGNKVNWSASHSRYNYFCSPKCSSLYTVKKRTDNFFEKYGVSNPSKTETIKQKIVETFKKFDNNHPSRDIRVRDAIKQTCRLRYNSDSPLESELILNKIKKTMVERYGVERALQNENLLEKQIRTTTEKYGVENFNQRHLSRESIVSKKLLNKESNVNDFFDLGYSSSHTYKLIKNAGIKLETSRSIAEQEILDFLEDELNRKLSANIKVDNTEFDIYDPITNIAIEYNGVYWHSEEYGKDRNYHISKTELAKKNNIRLIHIFSSEWDSKKDIVKSRLRHIFGISPKKIYARNCEIKEINSIDEKNFLNENHIQGYVPSTIAFGLYYKHELVSIMTFSKSRFDKSIDWELMRFASRLNFSIIGSASKLLCYFKKKYSGNIISYADIRWNTGEVYIKLGFKYIRKSAPGFHYSKNGILESRLKYQKHKLKKYKEYNEELTADQIMSLRGYSKIWDCGNLVYILDNSPVKRLCSFTTNR